MSTFRDPIIYPGEPERPRTWVTQRNRVCILGNHGIKPGTQVQLISEGVVACMPHAAEFDSWRRLRLPAICNIGGEQLEPGTVVRQVPMDSIIHGTHECRAHVQGAAA